MKVFVTKSILPNGITLLEENGHTVEVYEGKSPLSKKTLCEKAKASDALITMLSDQIDREFLKENTHLKVIANYAVGYNNIDIQAATDFGIKVSNTPDVLTDATADLALALLMDVSRKVTMSMNSIKAGRWTGWEPLGFIGQSLRGKTLGVFGAGRIGQRFANTCRKAFDMNIIYCARSEKEHFNATKVSFDQLLEDSDVISAHCDLNTETEGLFNKTAFSKMKDTAIFINTARGQIHNEEDLTQALIENTIWGAGLDVTNPEPMSKDSKLLKLSNIVITPHIGSATDTARGQMSTLVAKNVIEGLAGQKMSSGLN